MYSRVKTLPRVRGGSYTGSKFKESQAEVVAMGDDGGRAVT